MRLISPGDFELGYLRLERRLISFLGNHFTRYFLIVLIVLEIGIYFTGIQLNNDKSYLLLNGFKNFYIYHFFLSAIVLLSLGSIFLTQVGRLYYFFLSSLFLWVLTLFFLFDSFEQVAQNLQIALSYPVVMGIGWICLKLSLNQKHRTFWMFAFAIFFWSFYSSIYQSRDTLSQSALGYFWEFKLPFLWIFITSMMYYFPSNQKIDWELFLNPAHISRGVIWPIYYIENKNTIEDRKSLWFHGSFNLMIALIVLNVKMFIENYVVIQELSLTLKTSLIQFLRILTDVGIFNIMVGIARLNGINVPDATSFVILSRTPAEFWRRGSVYTYQFVLRGIYFPIVRILKNRFIAVFFAFLFFYFNRIGFERFFENVLRFGMNDAFKIDSLIFLLYFLNIIITQKYWLFSKAQLGTPAYGWISILMTHVLNISLVVFVRLLVKGVW